MDGLVLKPRRLFDDYLKFCQLRSGALDINLKEARDIGLNVTELDGDLLNLTWDLYITYKQRESLKLRKRKEDLAKKINELPPELLDKIKKSLELSDDAEVIGDGWA